MDGSRFDDLTRALTGSRRRLVGGTLAAVAGWAGLAASGAAKRRDKKPRFNRYGCVNVGEKCYGKNAHCCSGICDGKGKRSRCVAHGEGGCTVGDNTCAAYVACEGDGSCYRTTGKAGFCAGPICDCAPCKKDRDCQAVLGPGAACIVCTEDCVGVNGSKGTACVLPATSLGGETRGGDEQGDR
jgi:hypothetical protein